MNIVFDYIFAAIVCDSTDNNSRDIQQFVLIFKCNIYIYNILFKIFLQVNNWLMKKHIF